MVQDVNMWWIFIFFIFFILVDFCRNFQCFQYALCWECGMRLRDMSEKNDVKNSSSLIELNSTKRCCQKHSATIDFSGTLLFVNDEFFSLSSCSWCSNWCWIGVKFNHSIIGSIQSNHLVRVRIVCAGIAESDRATMSMRVCMWALDF